MQKRRVSVGFAKFWSGFDGMDFLREIPEICRYFHFELSDNPQFLFYSCFDGALPKGDFVRIFYTGENRRPNMDECDWALGFEYEDAINSPRYLRLPNYCFVCGANELVRVEQPVATKPRFCNFLYSKNISYRNTFFELLSCYRPVDAPGGCQNNFSHPSLKPRASKEWRFGIPEFMSEYKFTIAFENESHPGYTTEKIVHAMLGNSVPIYWGNPLIARDFNPKSFVNLHDLAEPHEHGLPHPSLGLMKRTVDLVRAIDSNDAMYRSFLNEPWFHENKTSPFMDPLRILRFFKKVFGES